MLPSVWNNSHPNYNASEIPLHITTLCGVRQLAPAFCKASLLATANSYNAASKLAEAKRQLAAALQGFRIRKEALDALH
jgi:hypothetical protein